MGISLQALLIKYANDLNLRTYEFTDQLNSLNNVLLLSVADAVAVAAVIVL